MVSTSSMAYVDFGADVSGVLLEDTILSPIFTRILLEAGASACDDVQLSCRIGTQTGSIHTNMAVIPVEQDDEDGIILDSHHFITKLFLKGKARLSLSLIRSPRLLKCQRRVRVGLKAVCNPLVIHFLIIE